jgi:hypothetical protein
MTVVQSRRNWKLDESCISNPKSEIGNRTRSNLKFPLSDLKCRIRPISKFCLLIWLSLFSFAPKAVLAQQEPKAEATQAQTAGTQAKPEPETDKDGKLIAVPGGKALGMSILGNQEAPKALVIVPWKRSELGNALGISTLLDDSRQPVDKEVFMRMLSYYEIRSGSTPATTNAAQPATAAPRRK